MSVIWMTVHEATACGEILAPTGMILIQGDSHVVVPINRRPGSLVVYERRALELV